MDLPTPQSQANAARHSAASNPTFVAQMVVFVLAAMALSFMAGVWLTHSTDSPHNDKHFDIFWQGWDVLDAEFYYDLPDEQEMVRGALQGLLSATGDRYTFLAPPQIAELDRQETAGEFGGIGAYISLDADNHLVITMPFNDFPAEKAGLRTGDAVLEIDGTSVEGLTLGDAVALMRGEVGTDVTLQIYRPSEDREFTVTVTRARVEMPTVYAQRFDDVGYVRLFGFNERATEQLEREIGDLFDQGATSLILDVRGNPGGLLDQAVGVSDLFLDAGVVVTQRNRNGNTVVYRSEDGQLAEDVPLVVLIDDMSASASEVVAGALHDRERATLIGQTSFGKGSVQHVYDLPDGSQLHVTVALWFTPNETPIQGTGLHPDIVIDAQEAPNLENDPYIQAALRTLRGSEDDTQPPAAIPETEKPHGAQS